MKEFLAKLKLTDKAYNAMKWITQYLVPALGTLYFALARTWGLPYGYEMLGTLTALDTFLGLILGISTTNYQGDGTLKIDTSNPQKDLYRLNMEIPLEDCANKKFLTLKVDNDSSSKG